MGDANPLLSQDGAAREAPAAKPVPRQSPLPVKPRKNLTIFLREWHKRAGLFAFVFMGWLGFSGVVINESSSFGYDTVPIYWSPVMWLYGLKAEPPESGFTASGHTLAVTPEGTVLDARPVVPAVKAPIGLVAGGTHEAPLLFLANAEHVAVVTLDGKRYDELRSPILPVSQIRRIGKVKGVAESIAVQELDAFQSVDGGTNWKPVDPATVDWSVAGELPASEREKLMPFSRPSVTLEHVLVDAHSGAIFGRAGVYVINTVGIAAVFLAISGVWMWWRTSRKRRS